MFTLYLIVGIFSLLLYIYNRAIGNLVVVDKMFKGPKRIPLLGCPQELVLTFSREGMFHAIVDIHKRYDFKVYLAWMVHKLYVFTADPAIVEIVLTSDKTSDKADFYKMASPWVHEGIFTSSGAKWKSHRKLITPAFNLRILQGFQDIFYKNSQILTDKYLQRDGEGSFDVRQYNAPKALDDICETAMGTSIKANNADYLKAIYTILDCFYARLVFPWYRPDFIFNLSRVNRLQKKSVDIVRNFTTHIINKRKEERKKLAENPNQNVVEDLEIKKRNAFLDIVLDAADEGKWTEADLRAEVDTMVAAGFDTVATAIDFAIFNLSQHQDVQDKVCKELEAILGDEERCPTYQELQSMKYLERVIKESLRLYPSVPAVARYVQEDLPLGDGRYIPAGADIFVNAIALHRNPDVYKDPLVFDPDRWTPEEMGKRSPFAFVAFSAGPRNCIGYGYAMLQIKITLASVLKKVHLLPCKPEEMPRMNVSIVTYSSNGVNVKVRARSKVWSREDKSD